MDDVRKHATDGAPLVAAAPDLGLTRSAIPCAPRAFLAGTTAFGDRDSVARSLGNRPLPEEVVPWGGPTLGRASGTVTWVLAEPEHLALDVVADAPTALVVTDEYAEGWTAQVDGQAVAIHPTLFAVRCVEVPAGRHRVEFFYRTPRFTAGLCLAVWGLLAGLGLVATGFRRVRPSASRGLSP